MRSYQIAIVVRRAEARLSDGYKYRSDAQYIHLLVRVDDRATHISFIVGARFHLELAEKLVRLYEDHRITTLIEDGRSLTIRDVRNTVSGMRYHPEDYR